jgi:hypothetical protein
MRKHISEYSDKDLAKLHGQFNKLKTYQERVEFVYSHFGKVYGPIDKYGTDFNFSIKPKDKEENRIRWMYFFERRKEETFLKLKSDHESRYEKVSDKARFIEDSLVKVREIYESSRYLKDGYEMGALAKGLDWLNWDPKDTHYDLQDTLQPRYEGLAYYELEKWLIGLKEEFDEFNRIDGSLKKKILNPRERFVLAHELKIIDLLLKDSNFAHDRVRFAKVLSLLFGYELDDKDSINGQDSRAIYDIVRSYHGGINKKGPLNKKNLDSVWSKLSSLGLIRPKSKT